MNNEESLNIFGQADFEELFKDLDQCTHEYDDNEEMISIAQKYDALATQNKLPIQELYTQLPEKRILPEKKYY